MATLLSLATFGPVLAIQSISPTPWSAVSLTLPADLAASDPTEISIDRISFSQTGEGWVSLTIGRYPPAFEGLARSVDEGISWRLLPPLVGYRGIDSFFFLNANEGWVSTGDSPGSSAILLHTSDGGQTWARWSSLESFKVRGLLDMHFDTDGSGIAVGMVMPGQTGVILRSNDFGRTWWVEKTTDTTLYRLAFAGTNEWAVGLDFILQSVNRQGWKTVYQRPGSDLIWGVDSADNLVVANTRVGNLVRSEDGGQTWEVVSFPAPYDDLHILPVKFANPRQGWIGGHHGVVLATKDGGKTWGFETQLKSYFIRDITASKSKVFVVGDDGLIAWRTKP